MKSRRASANRVKIHFNYTPDEVAELTGAHKNTVLRWIGSGDLPAITDCRPYLVLGKELFAFLKKETGARTKLGPGQCYCVKCKKGQLPALGIADFRPANDRWGNLMGICPACETLMYRRTSIARLGEIKGSLNVTLLQTQPHLNPRTSPSTNVESQVESHDQA